MKKHARKLCRQSADISSEKYKNSHQLYNLIVSRHWATLVGTLLMQKVQGKGRALVIAPLSRHGHHRGAQVHGAHQAASHIPALYLPSRSQYSFTDPERMEDWVSPGPGCKEQLAHGCYAIARSQPDLNQPATATRWSSVLTTRLSRHSTHNV